MFTNNSELVPQIIGWILVVSGFFNAYKYIWESNKIRKVGTAKGHSRKFINTALINDSIRFVYLMYRPDLYLILTTVCALICMTWMFWTIYWFYPYRNRNLINFRRPSLYLYIINSFLPNRLRKRL